VVSGSERERLQKFLARAGVASRRAAEELIVAGRVRVNGRPATLGQSVGPGDDVRVDGRPVEVASRHVTFALHKPRGVVTSASDERGRQTVLDLVPRVPGLHPVGRLDRMSEGLILLTTDGELTLHLTHPRYEHEKEYRVWTDPEPTRDHLAEIRRGVMLDDGLSRPAKVSPAPGGAWVVLREGRNRQVRRTFEAVGLEVRRLMRTRIGSLQLADLRPREWRELNRSELRELSGGL
jgi:23S rRNA pseudouridine2605 synthase